MYFLSGHESDSVSSTADFVLKRAAVPHQKDQNKSLLDKLTREKLDSKTKLGSKRNDISSGAGRAGCHDFFTPTSPLFFVCVLGFELFILIRLLLRHFICFLSTFCSSLFLCTFVVWLNLLCVTLIYLTHSICLENTLPL